jgi:hypothetical protein
VQLIYQNYQYNEYINQNSVPNIIKLKGIKGALLDITPYTYLTYTHAGEDTSHSLIIGETGIFDNFSD